MYFHAEKIIAPGITFLRQVEYKLTTIEDETVPLHAELKKEYFLMTLLTMFLLLIFFSVLFYLISCNKYRRRIRQLYSSKNVYRGWNYKKLKQAILELENQKLQEEVLVEEIMLASKINFQDKNQ